jgi:polyphosphate kinase
MSTPIEPRERYLNRELSWLAFNERVLALAQDARRPLLERVKFLAIFGSNLDEFFQVRVATLRTQGEVGLAGTSADGRTPQEQLAEIRPRVEGMVRTAADLFLRELVPALACEGIEIVDLGALGESERERLRVLFEEEIFPTLTPLAVDPAHPFPYISNLSLNLAVMVQDLEDHEQRFARVKIPPLLPRFLPLPEGRRFVPVEQVIRAHLGALFPGMEVLSATLFQVTRDADLAVDEGEADDLLVAMESGLRRRHRESRAIRLEIERSAPEQVRSLLLEELELRDEDVYALEGPIDLSGLWGIADLDRPDLKYERWVPRTPRAMMPRPDESRVDLFARLREGDVLIHHPYDAFQTSVQAFLEQAADDPDVLAIKHTLYRTASSPENPIVETLVRAAESGKQVVTLVEVKARFDEEANIEWARQLERAGVHVVYGLVGLKTHAKAALVVRREAGRIRRYCHAGTGNYNAATATVYEDLGLLTANDALGADLGELFNYLTGASRQLRYRKILVAPETLRPWLLARIRREIEAGDGEIALKMNNLSDPAVIDALYEASQAGVRVDLVIRSICCLRPGVQGLSEGIRVRSILGRFLEHSRIWRFGSEARGREVYIGSADLMPRKIDHRVELMVPVEDPTVRARVEEILELCLADDGLAWELEASGEWKRVSCTRNLRVQERLMELARERSASAEAAAR